MGAAYGLYARFPWASLGLADSPARWVLPSVLALTGLALSLLRPMGRPLAAWLVNLASYALLPRCFTGPLNARTSCLLENGLVHEDREHR